MNELELIEKLTRALPTNKSVRVGAGDDCAVLEIGGQLLLFKTDAVVEGIHFTPDAQPRQIGHKALARCLSDIAAMAGTPLAALITIGLPRDFSPERVEAIYEGINALAKRFGVAVAGGETVANPSGIFISVSMLGTAQRCILRSGAKGGDALFVTGELGGSIDGKHLDFVPRLTEAQWLAASFDIHAMIDVSDGLASDIRHILKASGVGAELHAQAIPISRAAKVRAKASSTAKPPLAAALTDGEDFELLFAVASKDAVPLLDGFKKVFPEVRLSCVGKITAERGLRLRDTTGVKPITADGYDHFKKS